MADNSEFPATKTVHWPTGPTDACDDHAAKMVSLGQIMGSHIAVTDAAADAECSNCINENKQRRARDDLQN